MTTVASLVFEMSANVARLQTDMSKARGTVGTAMNGIRGAAETARHALEALGVGVSLHAFKDMVEGAIASTAALHQLAVQTGQTVETISALREVARESNTPMEAVATGLQKLAKNMVDANAGTGKAAAAFQSLGIEVVNADGTLRDGGEVMQEIAGKLAQMGNRTQAVAYEQFLLGKSGAQLGQFLAQLAEQHELVATRTTAQAERAHDLEVAMAKLSARTQLLKEDFALGLSPALQQILAVYTDLNRRTDEATTLGQVLGDAFKYAALAGGNVWLTLKDMGDSLGALAAQAVALVHGDLAGVAAIGRARDEQYERNKAQFEALQKAMLAPSTAVAHEAEARGDFNPQLPGGPDAAGRGTGIWTPQMEEMFQARRAAYKESAQMSADAAKAAEAEANAAAKLNEQLEREAQHWKDVANPMAPYIRQLAEIESLRVQGRLNDADAATAQQKVQEHIDALNKVKEETSAADSITKQLGLTMASAAEKAITQFKSLRDVIQGLGQDIAQIIVRKTITEPVGAAVSNAVTSSGINQWIKDSFGGGKASGGAVYGGTPYLVGENGPELFMPDGGGNIVPNGALGGGDTHLNVSLNIQALDARSVLQAIAPLRNTFVAWTQQAWNQRGYATPMG